jgi:hypothetical protein
VTGDNIGWYRKIRICKYQGSTLVQLLLDKSFGGDDMTDWMSSLQISMLSDLTIDQKIFKNLVWNIILMKNFEFKDFMKSAMPAIQENLVTFKPDTRIYL